MLAYHARQGVVSARDLSELVGYQNHKGVNLQYGKVGKYLREASPIIAALPGQDTHSFAWFEKPRADEWQWHMYENVLSALEAMGWVRV